MAVTCVSSGSSISIHASLPSPLDDHAVLALPSNVLLAPQAPVLSPPKLLLTPITRAPLASDARLSPLGLCPVPASAGGVLQVRSWLRYTVTSGPMPPSL